MATSREILDRSSRKWIQQNHPTVWPPTPYEQLQTHC